MESSTSPEVWHLKYLQTVGGNQMVSSATLVLTNRDSEKDAKDAATGDGPVSALCNTIDRTVGLSGSMTISSIR